MTTANNNTLTGSVPAHKRLTGEINKLIYLDTYKIAVQNGYKGTVEEWLAQLNYSKVIFSCELTDHYIIEVHDMPELIAGHVYTVNYNGADYVCVCRQEEGYTYLGNASQVITEYTEPFQIVYIPGDAALVISLEELTGIRVNISEGYPYYYNYISKDLGEVVVQGRLKFTNSSIEDTFDIRTMKVGKTYRVKWCGAVYDCVLNMETGNDGSAYTIYWLGNFGLVNVENQGGGTGEPFLFYVWESGTRALVQNVYKYGSAEESIPYAIYDPARSQVDWNAAKGEPDYVKNRTHWIDYYGLAEIPVSGSWVLEDDEYYMFVMTAPIGLEIGKTYTVNWNGTDYQVVGQDASVASGDSMQGVYLGNAATGGGEDTGEPFAILELATAMDGMYGMAVSMDNTKAQFAICETGMVIHKLDNKFIDAEWMATTKEKALLEQQEFYIEDGNGADVGKVKDIPLEPDKTYIVYFNGVRHELPVMLMVPATQYEPDLYALYGDLFFLFWWHNENNIILLADSMIGQTVTIGISEYVPDPLPEEYLPESVDGVVIRSNTEGSEKKFKLTVDDSGTITATEV